MMNPIKPLESLNAHTRKCMQDCGTVNDGASKKCGAKDCTHKKCAKCKVTVVSDPGKNTAPPNVIPSDVYIPFSLPKPPDPRPPKPQPDTGVSFWKCVSDPFLPLRVMNRV